MKKTLLKILKPVAYVIGKTLKTFKIKRSIDGFRIQYPDEMTDWERGSLWGKYENHERILVKKYLRPDDRVLEKGACIFFNFEGTIPLLWRGVFAEGEDGVVPYAAKRTRGGSLSSKKTAVSFLV